MNGKEIVSRFLEAEAKQDVQGMADVLAEDIVFEMPFALPGLPDRVEGKGTVVEFLEKFSRQRARHVYQMGSSQYSDLSRRRPGSCLR